MAAALLTLCTIVATVVVVGAVVALLKDDADFDHRTLPYLGGGVALCVVLFLGSLIALAVSA